MIVADKRPVYCLLIHILSIAWVFGDFNLTFISRCAIIIL